jgi:hypothetical protein
VVLFPTLKGAPIMPHLFWKSLVAIFVISAGAMSASADTISTSNVSFSLSSSALVPPVPGQSASVTFTQFSPSLGTLTGVSVVGGGNVSYSAGDLGSCSTDSMTLTPSIGTTALAGVTLTNTPSNGCVLGSPHSFSLNGTDSFNVAAPGSLNDYIGLGTVGVGFSYAVSTSGEQANVAVSWSSTSTHLVYTYTPAVATVPEPNSLLLLGSGALTLIGAMRRKILR